MFCSNSALFTLLYLGPFRPRSLHALSRLTRRKEGDEYAAWMDSVDDGTLTFSDLPREQAWHHKAKMARFHSRANFENKLTYAGYRDVEVHYVVCEQDKIIPKEVQRALIETLKKYTAGEVTTHALSAGHLPFVTRRADTLNILREIAGGGSGGQWS